MLTQFLAFFLAFHIVSTAAESKSYNGDINSSKRKSEIFNTVLEGDYDVKIRAPGPNSTGKAGPVTIKLSLLIRSLENMDDVHMQYTVQLTFRQAWIDPRVYYEHLEKDVEYLQLLKPERIWMPDVFFANEKSSSFHKLMSPNLFTRIYPNGLIFQSYRITLVLQCPMNLRYYPMNKQICPIRLASYGWTTRDVLLKWRDFDAIAVATPLNLPQFQLNGHETTTCTSVTSAGNYSCIQLQFEFERRFGFYLIQIYVPCIMLVMVSWVSFWLGPLATEARISLGVTTILTIVTQTYGINQSVPPASYIKAIDVWTAVCQFMVFAAMIQFSYVNFLARVQWKKDLVQLKKEGDLESTEVEIDEQTTKGGSGKFGLSDEILRGRGEAKAKRVDTISKIFFPVGFGIFNVVYWTAYSNSPAVAQFAD